MRLLIQIIDWQYPANKSDVEIELWDLNNQNALMGLILMYGNGAPLELHVEGETQEVIDAFRGIVMGTGSSHSIDLSDTEKQTLWLYQQGDECYKQPIEQGGYTFINPKPQPDKFT